jgi:hypothetical protein
LRCESETVVVGALVVPVVEAAAPHHVAFIDAPLDEP